MSRDDDIRAAEKAVAAATLEDEAADFERPHLRAAVRRECSRLRALQSPLPSREEMMERHIELWGVPIDGMTGAGLAEQHWADCMRWLADRPAEECEHNALIDRASELEERS